MRHVLSARQFDRSHLEDLFALAQDMEGLTKRRSLPDSTGPDGIVILFYQPSTRTRSSFRHAANCLRIPVWYETEDASVFSSAVKGESLEDTIRMFCNYPYVKAIVLRHPEDLSAQTAAGVADPFGIGIINGGNGTIEHPTQALLDLDTIRRNTTKELGQVQLVVANDIEFSRTIRSLLIMLSINYQPPEIGICAPEGINLPVDVQEELDGHGVGIRVFRDLAEAARWADFLYMTRPQIEYAARGIEDPEEKKAAIAARKELFRDFRLTQEILDSLDDDCSCKVMHPMPIDRRDFNEIAPEASHHPRCIYYSQAQNGLYIRMALLRKLFDN